MTWFNQGDGFLGWVSNTFTTVERDWYLRVCWVSLDTERTEDDLCDDGTDLAGGGGKAMRGRSVSGWEAFTGYDEGGGVGSEVEEELAQHIKREKCVGPELVVSESDDDEQNREQDEAHELNWLSANGVHL